MSNYTKDRNIITISLDGVNGNYTLDINTGVYCGVKGNPIKTVPNKSAVRQMFNRWNNNDTNLGRAICIMLDNTTKTSQFVGYVETLQSADKIDAVGLDCKYLYDDQMIYLAKNIKYLSAWLKNNDKARFEYPTFKTWCEYEKVRNSLGNLANTLTPEIYHALIRCKNDLTIEELGVCAYYISKCKYWEYHDGRVDKLVDYLKLCRILEVVPQKVNNFMREYCEIKHTYELRKKEFDNKAMAMNYADHNNAWAFEYGNYKVVIPNTAQDIVTEGLEMHHCVGGYVDRVVNGSTFICFIRHKDTPDKCYITCEVKPNGMINQYFLAYDRYISTDEDKEFKAAFQRHLNEVWG